MKIHKEGRTELGFICSGAFIILALASIINHFNVIFWILTCCVTLICAFLLFFFRSPLRNPIGNHTTVTSPADGRVVIIKKVTENEFIKGEAFQISIYMDFINVHINWFPISGDVIYNKYHPGKYYLAWHPKSSTHNEHTSIAVKNANNQVVFFRQIAGFFARRIVCYSHVGDKVKSGQEVGFIKFGSRADLFLPLDTKINVKVGDHVKGTETIIAEL
ncbi:MAG: phosphatidylserine decarboxylase family protein [Bacteroidales bacterium]